MARGLAIRPVEGIAVNPFSPGDDAPGGIAAPPPPPSASAVEPADAEDLRGNVLAVRTVRSPRPRPIWHFVLLSTVTLGLYQLVWLHAAWCYVRDLRGARVQPVLRAVFAPIFTYSLLRHLAEIARERGYPEEPPAAPLALMYFVLGALGRLLPLPLALAGLLNVVPLLPAVEMQQFAVRASVPDAPEQTGFTRLELVLMVLGLVMWSAILAAIADPSLVKPGT